ncbi:hypothetical protein M434DRAFT_32352 [Hypoxylon sp. CO27-5]|nr:hypothetical protein M434DRAFT_32352 [Hypoxylon sp. CO27-5]
MAALPDQRHCISLIASYTGKLEVICHSIPHDESPEIFMAARGQTYKSHVPDHNLPPNCRGCCGASDYCTILTGALREQSVPGAPNHTAFWAKCENLVLDEEHNEHPKVAMLTRLEDRMVAPRVFRMSPA